MPRPRRGLGQGLSALVPGVEARPDPAAPAMDSPPGNAQDDETPPAAFPRWEYACLARPPRKRKGRKKQRRARVWFSAPGAAALFREPPLSIAAGAWWSALGLLGDEGWELAGVDGRLLYFKRRVRQVAARGNRRHAALP